MTLSRAFIANQGELAVRIIRACHGLGIETIEGVSDVDRESLPAKMANRAICIGPARFQRRASPHPVGGGEN